MKHKFFNLNSILLLFLFLIGFSPQANNILFNPVYATNEDTLTTDFNEQLSSVIDNGTDGAKAIINDVTESITLMSDNLSSLSRGIGGFALALSVAVIAIIGFKIMNSGKGNVFELIKQKKELSNAIICVIFITAIPYFVKEISNFQIPKELFSSIDSEYTGNSTIGDLNISPKSGLATYLIENKSNLVPGEQEANVNGPFREVTNEGGFTKGIGKMIYEAILGVIAAMTYAPIAFIAGFLGNIGFYPVSLDATMYDSTVFQVFQDYLKVAAPATVSSTSGIISSVASGLGSLTVVLNLLYYVAKKFTSLALEFVCYYYGVMHLLNKDTDDVGKFLVRLSQGLIGMTLFPYLLEFLLDLDGIIAMSILRLTGDSLPGYALLGLIFPINTVNNGFTTLILGICLVLLICAMAKSFFVRRIEISLYYVISPIFFLKHIIAPKDGTVSILTKKILSSVFLTTLYAPVFAIISLLIKLGTIKTDGELVYFMIIIGLLWMGNQVVRSIMQIFAGNSAAAADAMKRFSEAQQKPADFAGKTAKTAAMAGAYGLTKGAINGINNVKENGFKGAMAKSAAEFGNQFKNQDGTQTFNSIAKGIGKTAASVTGAKYATNAARAAFWEKYNKYGRKYDGDVLDAKAESGKTEALEREVDAKTTSQMSKEKQNEAQNRTSIYNDVLRKDGEKAASLAVLKYDKLLKNRLNNDDDIKKESSMMKNAVDKTVNEKFGGRDNLPEELKNKYDEYSEVHDSIQSALQLKNSILDKPNLTKEDLAKANDYDKIINGGYSYLKQNQTRMDRLISKTTEHNANVALSNAFGALSTATFGEETYDGGNGITIKPQGHVVDSLKKLQSSVNPESELGREINTILQKGDFSETTISTFTNSLINNKNAGITENIKSDFINGAFNIDRNKTAANMQLHGSIATSALDRTMSSIIGNGYDATQVKSKMETFGLNSNSKFTEAYNSTFKGAAPTATELASFVNEQRHNNVIDDSTANLFLSSAFNCSKDNTASVLKVAQEKSLLNNRVEKLNVTTPSQINTNLKSFKSNLESENCSLTNRDVVSQLNTLTKTGQINTNQAISAVKETFNISSNEAAQNILSNKEVAGFNLNNVVDRGNIGTLVKTIESASYDETLANKYDTIISSLNVNEQSTVQDVMSNISAKCYENNLNTGDAEHIANLVFSDNASVQASSKNLLEHVRVEEFKSDMLNSNSSYSSIFEMQTKHKEMLNANSVNLTSDVISQNTKEFSNSALQEGIFYRRGNIAAAQVKNLINNLTAEASKVPPTEKEKANAYKEVINKATETLNVVNSSDTAKAEAQLKSFLNEQAKSDLIPKKDLNNVAQVSFGFKKNQANAQIETILNSGFVTNEEYTSQLKKYNKDSETAALDYIQLISGENKTHYETVSNNMADAIINKTSNAGIKNVLINLKSDENISLNNMSNVIKTNIAGSQYTASCEQKRRSLEKLNEAAVNVAPLESYDLNKGKLDTVSKDRAVYDKAEEKKKFNKNENSKIDFDPEYETDKFD